METRCLWYKLCLEIMCNLMDLTCKGYPQRDQDQRGETEGIPEECHDYFALMRRLKAHIQSSKSDDDKAILRSTAVFVTRHIHKFSANFQVTIVLSNNIIMLCNGNHSLQVISYRDRKGVQTVFPIESQVSYYLPPPLSLLFSISSSFCCFICFLCGGSFRAVTDNLLR